MGCTMAAILTLLGTFLFQQQITLAQGQHNIDRIRQGHNLRHSNQDEGIVLHGNHDDSTKALVQQNRILLQRCTDFELEIHFDAFAHEVVWVLFYSDTKYLSSTVYSQGFYNDTYNNAIVTMKDCIPPGSYNFTMFDAGDDGLCCDFGQGHYKYSVNQVWIHEGAQYGTREMTAFEVLPPPTVSPSPTVGPWPTAPPSLAPTVSCASNEVTLGLEIQHDGSPEAISWDLKDSNHVLVVSEEGYSYHNPFATSYREFCIAHGAYTFAIHSAFGPGLYGGFYKVSIDGDLVAQGEEFYGSEEKIFATPGATTWPTASPQPSASPTVSPRPTPLWTSSWTSQPTRVWTPQPTAAPTPAPTVECASNEVTFTLDMKLDGSSNEISWHLTDSAGNALLCGQGYPFG